MSNNQAKSNPVDLLRQTFTQYQKLQSQLAQLQMRLLTIVEVAGIPSAEANEILGTEFFVKPVGERPDTPDDD